MREIANGAASTGQRIRDAAVQLFAAKGFEATGIRDIAEAAGVSTAALYHYMGSKFDLLVAIMTGTMARLMRSAEELLDGVEQPAGRLATLVRTHVAAQVLEQPAPLVSDHEIRALPTEHRAAVVALRDRYEGLWSAALVDGSQSGSFRIDDPRIARLSLLEMCNGVGYWYRPTGPRSVVDVADLLADLALSMVEARRSNRRLRLGDVDGPPTARILETVIRIRDEYVADRAVAEDSRGRLAAVRDRS